jgi:B12-binding domain/radical SAM domain protein
VDAIYVAGGPHPSAKPEEVLEHFDYVVIGEGEETLPQLIQILKEKGDPGRVKGIGYKDKDRVVFPGKRAPIDLDLYPPFVPPILAPVEISRGCPWGCTYCQTPRLFGFEMRHRSIANIIKYARFHKDIRFTSPNALAYGSDGRKPRWDKVEELLKALSQLKKPVYFGTFPSEVRPEFVTDRAMELIAEHCANKVLNIGGQSGSNRVLKAIGRGHGVEDIKQACRLCLEYGITPVVDLIFGLPLESPEDQHLTLELARLIADLGGRVRAHYFASLPGTPLAKARPTPLAEEVAADLGRMALEGKLTGTWRPKGRTA